MIFITNINFISTLLKKLHAKNIHTIIETCGYFDFPKFEALIYPYLDMIYFDIKILKKDKHKFYCGVSNEIILENFIKLNRLGKNKIMPRIPLIPGITDKSANLKSIALFLKENNVTKASILPYNPVWHDKPYSLGIDFKNTKKNQSLVCASWMDEKKIDECRNVFEQQGISLV